MIYYVRQNQKQLKNVVKKNIFLCTISLFLVLLLQACAETAPVDPHFQTQQAVFTNRTVTVGQAQLNSAVALLKSKSLNITTQKKILTDQIEILNNKTAQKTYFVIHNANYINSNLQGMLDTKNKTIASLTSTYKGFYNSLPKSKIDFNSANQAKKNSKLDAQKHINNKIQDRLQKDDPFSIKGLYYDKFDNALIDKNFDKELFYYIELTDIKNIEKMIDDYKATNSTKNITSLCINAMNSEYSSYTDIQEECNNAAIAEIEIIMQGYSKSVVSQNTTEMIETIGKVVEIDKKFKLDYKKTDRFAKYVDSIELLLEQQNKESELNNITKQY